MFREHYPLYLAGRPEGATRSLDVVDKSTGRTATRVALADPAIVERAIAACASAVRPMRELAAYERRLVLEHCVRRFQERRSELALGLCVEAGKPIRDARGEVDRLIETFRTAAEEVSRPSGEVLSLDTAARTRDYQGSWRRFPVGACSFIAPFNFPLNLAAHKIAPAIAAGCPFVLKPASATPVGALLIGEVLAETALPAGSFSILPCTRADAEPLTTDPRFALLSFTGSPEVGWDLLARAGKKKVVLELGGNAAAIVDRDWDLDDAVQRVTLGAYYQAGQSCIKAQRVIVHADVYDAFRERFVAASRACKSGDPREEDTVLGPLIDEREAVRLEGWIAEARAAGARLLCGGTRHGAWLDATVLEDVPRTALVSCREAFGPVVVLSRFTDFEAALDQVNDSLYGLQAGVFTRDMQTALRAYERLDVGGVVIGDVPSFRADSMPYGGLKESGRGREGVRSAIEELTEVKMLVVRRVERR